MQGIWDEAIIDILSQGCSLEETGTNNWALTKNQAFDALKKFRSINAVISGGDVYEVDNGRFIPAYDNWYFEDVRSPDSSRRSIESAEKYISQYEATENTYFVLVPHRT